MSHKNQKLILSIFAVLALSSCGLFSKRNAAEQSKKQTAVVEHKKVVSPTPEPTTVASAELSIPPPETEKLAVEKKHYEVSTPVIPAETSLRWLKNGNTRFMKKNFRSDGRTQKDRERLAKGQHPHAIVLACSDSRVPPEIVFDQTLGEIFVIRVLGEALDATVIASIEYAVEHLHTGLLVVMGHSQCGAIQATVKTPEGTSAGSEYVDKVISDIRPRLASMKSEPASLNLEVESTLNADGVARDLVQRSSLLKNAVESGSLVIKAALYRVDSGKVTFY